MTTTATPPFGTATNISGGTNALNVALSAFPWWQQLAIPMSQLQGWIAQGLSGDALYNQITKTPQYESYFPAIRRSDGTKRMDEAQYKQREDDYRTLMKQYGDPSYSYTNPSDLSAFFEQEIDPNELKQRFDVYKSVQNDQDVKDAFYVYAGMKPTDDQLYYAIVSPTARKALEDEYNRQVAAKPLDYLTWVSRAAEAGLSRVTNMTGALTQQGILTGVALQRIQAVDPNFARQMMDQLYHGGDPSANTTQLLNLDELMHSFEYAMLGSAASVNGFQLPDKQRLEQIRNAGIDRTKALQAYGDYAHNQNLIAGEVSRAGGGTFGQNEFEQAVLLQQGDAAGTLAQAQAQEKALGHASGGPEFAKDRATGRTTQSGLRETFA